MREMVKQQTEAKNSSTRKPEVSGTQGLRGYRFPSLIEPISLVPEAITLLGPGSTEGVAYDYAIAGSLKNFKESNWPEPPHIAFANLRAEDPKAAEAFTKRYGILRRFCIDRNGETFTINGTYLLQLQDRLRQAWPGPGQQSGDVGAWADIEGEVEEEFDTDVVVSGGFVHLRPKDLWASICFLYLWDSTSNKLGFCENPDCPAPYFRKKRRTQKYCEQGPCVQYAQRRYSLDWWNREGKKRREKKAKAQRGRSKQRALTEASKKSR